MDRYIPIHNTADLYDLKKLLIPVISRVSNASVNYIVISLNSNLNREYIGYIPNSTPPSLNTRRTYGQLDKPFKPSLSPKGNDPHDRSYILLILPRQGRTPGARVLESLGCYDERYKLYLFNGVDATKKVPGVGQLIDHVLYYYPLDRSYIPWYFMPRVLKYGLSSATEPYTHIRLNSQNLSSLIVDPIYKKLNNLENSLGIFDRGSKQLYSFSNADLKYKYVNSRYSFYQDYEKVDGTDNTLYPYLRTVLQKRKFGLKGPIELGKYEVQDFERDFKKAQDLLLKQALAVTAARIDQLKKIGLKRKLVTQGYFDQTETPLYFSYSLADKVSVKPITLWANNSQSYKINDPLSYQAESYMYGLFRANSDGNYLYQTILGLDSPQSWDSGNLIKLWILDVNNKIIMTTPAFISLLQDGGLQGQWDLFSYVGSMYPKATYKGVSKRTIAFKLKLGCFDRKYLKQYIEKLNFLRLVGSPAYKEVEISRKYYGLNSSNGNITTSSTITLSYPKAPIYKLTLGSILYLTYGYFEACDFTWELELTTWNLDRTKLYRNNASTYILDLNKLDASSSIEDSMLIPIVTTINCNFVCLYGRGFSNTDQIYKGIAK